MFCKNCGRELKDDAKFCDNCGAKVVFKHANNDDDENEKPECDGKVTIAFVLGISSLAVWTLPVIGLPISIIGLVLGVKSNKVKLHTAAIILNIIGLVLSISLCFAGSFWGYLSYKSIL